MQDIAPPDIHFLPLADPDCHSTVALACRQNPTALVQHFIKTCTNPCGSGLAREGGVTVDINVEC
jgi:hypothetical protein